MMRTNLKLSNLLRGRAVTGVLQEGKELWVKFQDESVLRVKLEDEASSVMVRNGAGELEYAD